MSKPNNVVAFIEQMLGLTRRRMMASWIAVCVGTLFGAPLLAFATLSSAGPGGGGLAAGAASLVAGFCCMTALINGMRLFRYRADIAILDEFLRNVAASERGDQATPFVRAVAAHLCGRPLEDANWLMIAQLLDGLPDAAAERAKARLEGGSR